MTAYALAAALFGLMIHAVSGCLGRMARPGTRPVLVYALTWLLFTLGVNGGGTGAQAAFGAVFAGLTGFVAILRSLRGVAVVPSGDAPAEAMPEGPPGPEPAQEPAAS